MSKVTTQCPHCHSWQVGVVTSAGNNAKPSQTAQSKFQASKAQSARPSTESLSENQQWARVTLGKIGFLWGKDVSGKLHSVATARAERLLPKPAPRTGRHLVSTSLFLVSFSLGFFESLLFFANIGLLAWVLSISLHYWVAFKASNARTEAIRRLETELYRALKEELGWARKNLYAKGPFGTAKNPPPNRRPEGVNDEQAEHLCAGWLSHLGEEKVQVTRATSDGGIDILSTRCVTQVKNYKGSVGVVPVRELVGVASVDGRLPVFFTSGTYTKAAIEFAEEANVYLFRYDAEAGTLDARSSIARRALSAN